MHTAYAERTEGKKDAESMFTISSIVSIENVGEMSLITENLNYHLVHGEERYEGEFLDNQNPSITKIEPTEKITLNISFKVPFIQDSYKLIVGSSSSSSDEPWYINDLDKYEY
ncbi:hypothetical protein [Gracilibacillus salinarum]|uniref:DUF4352 domain-containing protein n=1 Tax=Gracilibacillus salinarum TaxID=2932255 RepID=A0ABY4GK26_9BACI|nr:hypothetical protein [Gracilibacillus salinarum]UOQ84716.1 hypothetical protein MUN87_18970 [Gracilibacillus salinarum]